MICEDLGIVQFDMDGTITDCNDRFLQLMGAKRENVIGFNLLTSSENKEMWWTVLSALSGKPGYYTGEYESRTGSRSLRVKATYAGIKSSSGEVIGGVGIFEEETEKKAERETARLYPFTPRKCS